MQSRITRPSKTNEKKYGMDQWNQHMLCGPLERNGPRKNYCQCQVDMKLTEGSAIEHRSPVVNHEASQLLQLLKPNICLCPFGKDYHRASEELD